MKNIKAIRDDSLSCRGDDRYILINTETGEIVDNAQGYGYKSIQGAYAAYSYKTRDRSKDKERELKKREIRKWMKEHKSFVEELDNIAFINLKDGIDKDISAKDVKDLLKNYGLTTNFTAGELLKVWRKGKF